MSHSKLSWPKYSIIVAAISALVAATGLSTQSVGDFDSDGSVGFSNVLLFASEFGGTETAFDLDGDGSVAFPDFLLFAQAFGAGNPTPDSPPVEILDPVSSVDGPIVIASSSDLSAFLAKITPDSFIVQGNFRISGIDHTDLTSLNGLREVQGDLTIDENDFLKSLKGLERVLLVGRNLQVARNVSLENLEGLERVRSIQGDLVLTGNATLASIDHLDWLGRVSGLVSIRDNTLLESLLGLRGLATVEGSLLIENNASLITLSGLENLGSIGQILSVRNNESLETLEGLELLGAAQGVVITDNPSLLPSEVNALLDQMVLRGFTGLTTIAANSVS